jgi:hypothetical protein
MGFSDRQTRALSRSVPAQHVRSRLRDGKQLSYVEGWYVLAQANRIFGFDGWDRETIETKCIIGREARGSSTAVYLARVRITVRTGAGVIVRDGHGTGEATGPSVGEVHDRALKAAETDATKRALATFGKAFGLALYVPKHPTDRSANDSAKADSSPVAADSVQREAIEIAAGAVPSRNSDVTTNSIGATNAAGVKVTAAADDRRIDKSVLALNEPSRIRDKEHLRYVASQPCLLCSATPSDAHHVRFAQPRAMGRKVGDEFTVPLCRTHHRELHQYGNEAAWWHDMGIDPLDIAAQLWDESHPKEAAE